MNTSQARQGIRIIVIIAFIAIVFMLWSGIVHRARADDQVQNKNGIQIATQAFDHGSFTIQAPGPASKNYASSNVPLNITGTTFSTEPAALSKNSADNYQP